MRVSLFIILLFTSIQVCAQEEFWDNYIAQYEKGPGSVLIDMGLFEYAPLIDYPYVVVTGVRVSRCDNNGFPENEEFQLLHLVSDKINEAISEMYPSKIVATFTHECKRLDYIYVKDTIGLRNRINNAYEVNFPNYTHNTTITPDKEWSFYHSLYPNEEIQNNMSNDKIIYKLLQSGDDLSKPRNVDHWIYFRDKDNRKKFADFARDKGFDTKNLKKTEGEFSYGLQLSREETISPSEINRITNELRINAKTMQGSYDGWETFVITKN